jgi:murein L,D-transpeptidase YafK
LAPKKSRVIIRLRRGHYILDRRNPKNRFYRSIHISYPHDQDKTTASPRGVSAGGDIMTHDLPNGFGWLGSTHRVRIGPMDVLR